jgi:hypothetical protein
MQHTGDSLRVESQFFMDIFEEQFSVLEGYQRVVS